MKKGIEDYYNQFNRNRRVLSFIAESPKSFAELKNYILQEMYEENKKPEEYKKSEGLAEYMLKLDPFVYVTEGSKYALNEEVLREVLKNIYLPFMAALFSKEEMEILTQSLHPDMIFLPTEQVESKENKSFKYMHEHLEKEFESLRKEYEKLKDQAERKADEKEDKTPNEELLKKEEEIACLKEEVRSLKEAINKEESAKDKEREEIKDETSAPEEVKEEENTKKEETLLEEDDGNENNNENCKNCRKTEVLEAVASMSRQVVYIEKLRIVENEKEENERERDVYPARKALREEELSLHPGVYKKVRPSFYEIPKEAYCSKSLKRKAAKRTREILKKRLGSEEETKRTSIEDSDQKAKERRKNLTELLNDESFSNEEKFLSYLLLTPDLDREYLKTLMKAKDLGFDAESVIRFLELPEEKYNKEIFELYISELNKETAFDYKKEVVRELMTGEFLVKGIINEKEESFVFVPVRKMEEDYEEIKKIFEEFQNKAGAN